MDISTDTIAATESFCEETDLEQFIGTQEAGILSNDATTNKLEKEIDEWLNQPRAHSSTNVLEFWKLKKYYFPELYKLASTVLAIPCTQVSVERAFSALGLVLTKTRTKLSPEHLTNILIIRLNSDLIDDVNV